MSKRPQPREQLQIGEAPASESDDRLPCPGWTMPTPGGIDPFDEEPPATEPEEQQ